MQALHLWSLVVISIAAFKSLSLILV
jgi:hypothetical protein